MTDPPLEINPAQYFPPGEKLPQLWLAVPSPSSSLTLKKTSPSSPVKVPSSISSARARRMTGWGRDGEVNSQYAYPSAASVYAWTEANVVWQDRVLRSAGRWEDWAR